VAQAPSPETYRQYLDRIIRPRVSGRFYSLEIMYLAVLDGQRNLVAYAKRDGLTIRDQAGRPLTRPDTVTGLRLLQMVDSGELARTEDIIPLSAELERGGQVIGIVRMGCKRSLAYRAATEIALRNLTLAVLLVLVGIAVSYELVGHLARPLEKLAAVVRRIAAGELDAPLLSQGSAETESLGLSVAHMVEQLRIGRLLQAGMAEQVARGPDGGPAALLGQVALLARPGMAGPGDESGRWRRCFRLWRATRAACPAWERARCSWALGGTSWSRTTRYAWWSQPWSGWRPWRSRAVPQPSPSWPCPHPAPPLTRFWPT